MRFEEKYMDVLQNLEFGIVQVYREHPEMTDYDVMDALEALRRHYIREARGQEQVTYNLTERAQEVFNSVKTFSEWRLGRGDSITDDEGNPVMPGTEALTLNEIIDCIKRIERSVQSWNKQGGRQGYLKFVAEHLP